jgi:hypothetical protein
MKIVRCVIFGLVIVLVACHKNVTKKHSPDFTATSKNEPALVWTSPIPPDSSALPPAIFYTPHQDDETLGMGASISGQSRSGRPVFVVLLTNGANQNMLDYLQSIHASSGMQGVIDARNNEFIAACKALGATRIYISNAGKGFDENITLEALIAEFKNTMNYFSAMFPGATHKTISGNCDPYNPSCEKMPAHQAAATALHELCNSGKITDGTLFRVYFYYGNAENCTRPCNWKKPVALADKLKRQQAINEYKLVDEKNHRYGLAYWHSVDVLFNNSWDSNFESVDSMRNDY